MKELASRRVDARCCLYSARQRDPHACSQDPKPHQTHHPQHSGPERANGMGGQVYVHVEDQEQVLVSLRIWTEKRDDAAMI